MLLRMGVSNYLSIAERQEISLVATKLKGPEDSLLEVPGSGDLKALPSAVIYGANASGKTNFIKAFRFMKNVILYSHRRGDPEGGVPRIAFGLNPDLAAKPTQVDADFIIDGVRYQYGFECDDDAFTSEWLYAFPEGKRRKLFERSGSDVDFGQSFKGPKKILVDLMRPNSLFLSTATQNDHEELTKIVSFFYRSGFNSAVSVAAEMLNNTFKKSQIDARSIKFLELIGTGITGYRLSDVNVPANVIAFTKEIQSLARKHMGDGLNIEVSEENEKHVSIELSHKGQSEEQCFFSLERESSGTRRLLLILNSIFKSLDEGSLVIVDELDASLHTFAAEQIIKLFSDRNINRLGAQLICTTHDTNLLSCPILRRDQVWFCEKNEVGASSIFPLSDIKSRPSDKFEQGYLEGRYGGIPYSGNIKSLFGE